MNVSRSLIVDDRRIGVKGSVVGTTYDILLNFIIIEDCDCEPFPVPSRPIPRTDVLCCLIYWMALRKSALASSGCRQGLQTAASDD